MKIEAGKSYRTHDGQRADVCFVGEIEVFGRIGGELFSWGRGGRYWGLIKTGLDLVGEWPEPEAAERATDLEKAAELKRILVECKRSMIRNDMLAPSLESRLVALEERVAKLEAGK